MVLATSITTTTRMLAMLANTAMAVTDVATELSRLLTMLQHRLWQEKGNV